MYFDSHVHFDGLGGWPEVNAAVDRARRAGVGGMIAVGADAASNAFAAECARRYPALVVAAVGYDRDCATAGDGLPALSLPTPEVRAVGEIGLDFHCHPETAVAQQDLFGRMLEAARRAHLPVIVHSRQAEEATLRLLTEHAGLCGGRPEAPGVVHCFTGGWEFARKLLDLGFLIGFSGIVTFRNAAELRDVAARVPEDRLLIETDAPYLAPEPHRGKRNEPAYVPLVADALAAARGAAREAIAEATASNARRLFGLPAAAASG